MSKKRVKKKTVSKKTKAGSHLEENLLHNMVELQKIHTSLVEKFDKLTEQISGLLQLFEMTARSFAEQPHIQMAEKDKEFLDKIDKLLEQNKTIAKGLTLMEEKMREKIYGSSPMSGSPRPQQPGRPLPRY